jgi:hypothetical protein
MTGAHIRVLIVIRPWGLRRNPGGSSVGLAAQSEDSRMSFIRLLPASLHAVADYAVGGLLILVAALSGGSAGAVGTGIIVGATVLVVSMFTRYPLGIIKVLPFTVHSAGDYLAAALLIAAPFALHFSSSDSGLTAFYVVAGLAVLAVSLITNYQYSPGREWSAEPQAA